MSGLRAPCTLRPPKKLVVSASVFLPLDGFMHTPLFGLGSFAAAPAVGAAVVDRKCQHSHAVRTVLFRACVMLSFLFLASLRRHTTPWQNQQILTPRPSELCLGIALPADSPEMCHIITWCRRELSRIYIYIYIRKRQP